MPRTINRLEAVATIGIDIGKNTFHLVGLDRNGAIVLRQKLSRRQVEARLANMPPCLIGMEACVGAHHLSRQLKAYGHDARLMPARYVRPYSKGQKNDFRDAEAIAEAVLRPTMKFVAIKTVEQLDLQALHRVRERLVCQRTSVINQIRAFLLERGIAVRQGLRALRTEMPIILAMTDKLSPRMIHMIEALCMDWRHLDGRIETVSDEIKTLSEQDDGAKRLMTCRALARSSRPQRSPRSAAATRSPRAEISALGSDSCRDKCRRAGAQSSGPSPSAAIATCECCLFRQLVPYYCARGAGRSMVSNPGSRLQPGGSIASS
jgi:transposase